MKIQKRNILLIEEDEHIRNIVGGILSRQGGHTVRPASSNEEGVRLFEENPDTDFVIKIKSIADDDCLDTIRHIKKRVFPPEVWLTIGYAPESIQKEASALQVKIINSTRLLKELAFAGMIPIGTGF